ncbi:MAG: hypothetical protein JWM61_1621 [Micrococcaceae bacterium]|jgi:ABC-type antimicrobial peptide transport system permease subunit|nr:hypothetical protein [Micrococcaceae bacterium]
MGITAGRSAQWFKDNRETLPASAALLGVAVFWVVGAVGGIGYLHNANSPMAILTGLYVMLAAVAVSIIITILAVMDLTRRLSRQRTRR